MRQFIRADAALGALATLALQILHLGSVSGFVDLRGPGQRYQNTTIFTATDSYSEGPCLASWAMAAAMAASDEFSVKNGTVRRLSYQHVMECCTDCYDGLPNGCSGGNFLKAMNFLNAQGTVSGGGSIPIGVSCKGYSFRECTLDPSKITGALPFCDSADYDATRFSSTCRTTCDAQGAGTTEKYKLSTPMQVTTTSYVSSMENILNAGSTNARALVTEMQVYEDLQWYNAGDVYTHLWGRHIGSVAVVIYGYGQDPMTGLNFWLVRMPFGNSFGDGGYMKVHKGANACGIENPGNSYYFS